MPKFVKAMKKYLQRPGIEPGPPAWQARILPLNQRCRWLRLIVEPLYKNITENIIVFYMLFFITNKCHQYDASSVYQFQRILNCA